jgi:VWFA-related protein
LVTDGNDRPISDLRRQDFAIAEDGAKQTIDFFAHGDLPVNFSLVFDVSDSEQLKLMAQQAAHGFVNRTNSTDDVSIPQLKASREKVREFAADKRKVENASSEISPKNKLAELIAETIKARTMESKAPHSAIIVITDGLSLSGATSDRDAAYAILRQNTPIYFIILDVGGHTSRPASQSRLRQTKALMTRIAEISGGQALVVKRNDEISAATEQIIHRLKNQYALAYYPTNDKHDGSFRYVSVTVTPKDKRKVKVFAPLGYYAPDITKSREGKTDDK